MPEPATVCEVDAPPFSNITWEDILRDMDEDGEAAADDGGNLELRRRATAVSLDKALEKFSEIGQMTLGWRI